MLFCEAKLIREKKRETNGLYVFCGIINVVVSLVWIGSSINGLIQGFNAYDKSFKNLCLVLAAVTFILTAMLIILAIVISKKPAEKEPPLTNVRLILGDVSEILNIFGEGEVDVIYLNFSDPWPKKRHAKRRLTYRDFLKRYALILKEGGEIRFKTDNKDLFDFSIEEFKAMGWELSHVTYDLHAAPVAGDVETEYEEKFSRKGNPVCRLVARRP